MILERIKRFFKPSFFTIRIGNGKAEMKKGKTERAFLNELAELTEKNNITDARVYGIKCEYGIRLEFSNNIPANIQQRIRNLYGIYVK